MGFVGVGEKILSNTPFHCYQKQGYPVYLLRVGKGDSSLALDFVPDEVHVYSTLVRGEHMIRSIILMRRKTPKVSGRKDEGGIKGEFLRRQSRHEIADGG